MAQVTNPLYETWLASHPGEKLYTKPIYRRGFLAGIKDRQCQAPHHSTLNPPYCTGYSDGWNAARLEAEREGAE